ncbi:patatin family phospholipase [Zalerion maritima]|uniref:Patatin-like phospholipase domain-containing protein n=1 Tax=Zalerion maritima TaxID=339359 RepID=A0AAD5RIL2_9PEZI|nr:patatin family phospholipase [Zalerion maritima]
MDPLVQDWVARSCAQARNGDVITKATRVLLAANKLQYNSVSKPSETRKQAPSSPRQLRKYLIEVQAAATDYRTWLCAGQTLNELNGSDAWIRQLRDPTLERLTKLLDAAREKNDLNRLFVAANRHLNRCPSVMGSLKTYEQAPGDTPNVIKQYVYSACHLLSELSTHPDVTSNTIPNIHERVENLIENRKSFGRTALLLSGGATLGMAHMGVIKAMIEYGVLPRVISGASAGSIICAVLCTTTEVNIPALIHMFHDGDLSVFDPPNDKSGWSRWVYRLIRLTCAKTMADAENIERVMNDFFDTITFLEAYRKTKRICNITVSSPTISGSYKVLNYITAPHVTIASAVTASCAVPAVFAPASLKMKDPVTQEVSPWTSLEDVYIDGSVDCDLPMEALAEMFHVNHCIVSQVNPHVTGLLDENTEGPPRKSREMVQAGIEALNDQVEALLSLEVMSEGAALIIHKTLGILRQRYTGDLTVLPLMDLPEDFLVLIDNPTREFMLKARDRGQRAVLPWVQRMKDYMAIERAFDDCNNLLSERLAFHPACESVRRGFMDIEDPPFRRSPKAQRPHLNRGNYSQDHVSGVARRKRTAVRQPFPLTPMTESSQDNPAVGKSGPNPHHEEGGLWMSYRRGNSQHEGTLGSGIEDEGVDVRSVELYIDAELDYQQLFNSLERLQASFRGEPAQTSRLASPSISPRTVVKDPKRCGMYMTNQPNYVMDATEQITRPVIGDGPSSPQLDVNSVIDPGPAVDTAGIDTKLEQPSQEDTTVESETDLEGVKRRSSWMGWA